MSGMFLVQRRRVSPALLDAQLTCQTADGRVIGRNRTSVPQPPGPENTTLY